MDIYLVLLRVLLIVDHIIADALVVTTGAFAPVFDLVLDVCQLPVRGTTLLAVNQLRLKTLYAVDLFETFL